MQDALITRERLDNIKKTLKAQRPNTYENVLPIVEILHGRQTDKGGNPYIVHLKNVSRNAEKILENKIGNQKSNKDLLRRSSVCGLLHDSIEDVIVEEHDGSKHALTEKDLEELGVEENIIKSVILLTKKKDKTTPRKKSTNAWDKYKEQINHLLDYNPTIRQNRSETEIYLVAIACKMADNKHNADISRLPEEKRTTTASVQNTEKYRKSFSILENVLSQAVSYLKEKIP